MTADHPEDAQEHVLYRGNSREIYMYNPNTDTWWDGDVNPSYRMWGDPVQHLYRTVKAVRVKMQRGHVACPVFSMDFWVQNLVLDV